MGAPPSLAQPRRFVLGTAGPIDPGTPVITARDLAEPEWLDLVRGEVTGRLRASRVRWDPVLAVSARSGEGLDELREALRRVARDLVERPLEDLFRLPIDRVFALPG